VTEPPAGPPLALALAMALALALVLVSGPTFDL